MSNISLSRNKSSRALVNLLIIYSYIVIAFFMSYFLTNENLTTSLFYCFVVLLAVMFAGFAELTQQNKLLYTSFLFLSFSILFFIYGFRDFSAIDDPSYIKMFENVSFMGWLEYFKQSTIEPGYLILNYMVSLFTDNYFYMQLLTSFIPLAIFYFGFHKYRKIISLPTAVFLLCSMLYFQMLAVALIRMFVAIGIVFIALRHIPEHKPIRYILKILIASTFHYSAFFMAFLAYFAVDKEGLSKKVTRIYAILFTGSPFVFIFIGRFIVPLLGGRYERYSIIGSVNFSISTITTIPLIILLLLFYKRFVGNRQLYFKLFMMIYALSIIISLFGGMIGLGRLIFYSYAAFILAVAMISKKIRFQPSKVFFL